MTVEPGLVEMFERYMRERHIPDLLATGRFRGAVFLRAAPGRYRVRYEAASERDLARYLAEDAPRFREDFTTRFAAGITLARETWLTIQSWGVTGDHAMGR